MKPGDTSDTLCLGAVEIFASRGQFDRRYWFCFVLGYAHVRLDFWAVCDDFGNLVGVQR